MEQYYRCNESNRVRVEGFLFVQFGIGFKENSTTFYVIKMQLGKSCEKEVEEAERLKRC